MTNQGLSIEVRLEMAEPTFYHNYAGIFLAPLNCTRAAEGESKKALEIFVEGRSCTEANVNPNQYVSRFAATLLITDVSTWPYQCRCNDMSEDGTIMDIPGRKRSNFHGVFYFKQP
jgi:hypothetical protein